MLLRPPAAVAAVPPDSPPDDPRHTDRRPKCFGEIVGRILRASGFEATVLEFDTDQVDLLRRMGIQAFYGDATRHDLLEAAGAAEAELLVVAVDVNPLRSWLISQRGYQNDGVLYRFFSMERYPDFKTPVATDYMSACRAIRIWEDRKSGI